MGNPKKFMAWIFGIAVCLSLGVLLTWLGEQVGVKSSRYGRYDDEGVITFYGYMLTAVSGMVGAWAGQSAYNKSLTGGLNRETWLGFRAWFFGFLVLGIFAVVFDLAFRRFSGTGASILVFAIHLSTIAGVAWATYHWWKMRLVAIGAANDPT